MPEAKIRWATKSGKNARPPLDGSLHFDFGQQHVREILAHRGRKGPKDDLPIDPDLVA